MKQNLFKSLMLLLLIMFPVVVFAQGTVSGSVSDEEGLPLPGVNVVIQGTSKGTTSDFDGNFSIEISDFPANLVFSSLGYERKTIAVTSPTTLNVVLGQAATGLEEVVVTGLATSVKRSNLANTVATISSEQLVGVVQPQTLDAALAGQFTGAVVNANSGAPGGGLSVKLRGATSIFGNSQPLYIVDGVYVDNSSIAAGLNVVSAAAAGGSASNQDNPSNRIADLDPND
ncbi:MAG: carboxypeptidase-like regulatory domain-containing protein, partial [Sinomicrobium sp.]|nr:carboxypeptidase-like regulatory domain-containing protein [Sinomicrobium sp.]